MKHLCPLTFAAASLIASTALFSQEAPPADAAVTEEVAVIPEIPATEPEQPVISFTEGLFPEDDQALFQACVQLIQRDRIAEAAMGIDELKKRETPESELTYLDFSVHFQLREFEKAKAIVAEARHKEWGGFRENFNYAQCLFLLEEYEEAASAFETLAKTEKIAESVADTVRFQQFVCLAKQGRKDTPEAKQIERDYDEFSNTPIFYMAKAIHEFEAEKSGEAAAWVRSAQGIYPATVIAPFLDSLYEAGYMFDLNYPERVDFDELKRKRVEAEAKAAAEKGDA